MIWRRSRGVGLTVGDSDAAIARQLGVSDGLIRKLAGPRRRPDAPR